MIFSRRAGSRDGGRAFGLLTGRHPLLDRIPEVTRPHAELLDPDAMWGTDPYVVATAVARACHVVPVTLWQMLRPWQTDELRRAGAIPGIAGGGQQESYRALGASFAITSTIHVHIKVLGSASQQATLTMLVAGFDGTSGVATAEVDSSTEATAGTAGTAPTATQIRRYPAVTALTTATGNFTVEGTTYTATDVLLLPLPTAPLILQYPLGRELETQPAATTAGKAILLRGSTTVNCNMRGMAEWEE